MNYQNSLENNLNTDDYYLKHFQKHCLDTGEFAYHSCSKKRSKFLICKNNQNEIFFVICSLCKKVYKSNFIQNYCFPCNKNYYSKFIENDNFLFPATWEKYHCQLLINEKMKCIKCKEILYLNIKTNTLICLNKQCNFQSNPQRILWTCALCKEEFKSRAILYNNLEMEKLKNIIKFSLILKNKAKPKNLPCKCVNNNNEFVHKKDCDGKLFFGEFDNNNNNNNNNNKSLLVICNKCQAVNYYERFIWTCPVCGIRFRDKKYHKNYNYNSNGNLLFKPYVNEKFFTEKKFNNDDNNDNNNFCDGFNCRSTTNIFVDCNNNNNNNDNNNVYNSNKKKVFGKGRKIFESGNLNKRKNLNLNSNLKINNNNNNNNNEEKDDFNKSIVKNLFNNDENNKKHSNRNNNKEMIKSETKIDLFNYKLNKENKNNKNRLLNKSESKKDFFKINNNNNNNHFEKKNLSITPISTERGIYKKKNENKREIKKNLNDDFNFTTNNVFINNNNNENNDDLNKTIIDRTNLLLNKNNNNNKNKRLRKISSEKNFFNTENNNISKIIEKKIHKINNNNNNKRIHQLSTVFEEEIKQNNNNENNNENKENNNENNKKIIKYDSNNNINKKEKEKKYNEEIKKNKFLDYDSIMKKLSEKKDDDKKGVVTLYREHKQREIERKERIHKEKIEKLKSKNKITLINECSKNDDSNENILKENIKNLEKIIFNNNNNNNNKNIKNINNNNNNDNLSVSCNSTSLESNNNNNNKISKSKNSNYSDLLIKDKISLNKINNNNNTNNNNNIENELILKQDSNNKINNSNIKINNNSNINSLNDSNNNNNNNNLNNNFIITNQNISDRISNILNNSKISPFSLSDYTLESTLGEGTYGTIFLSTHKATKNKFAIKKIIAKDIFELEDFQKEFEILNSCQHEYILKVKSYTIQILDETTFALYVLMELALFDWESEIKKKSSIKKFYTENELITILKKLLNALFFLQNNKKIAHRDLKPQNILIFPNNIFKLSDFGEAKIISNNINTNNNKKQMNTLRGTELYMAPILYKGCKLDLDDVSHEPFKSDVYSLGVCFVYAATLNFKVLYEVRDCEKNEEIKYVLEKYLKFKYSDEFISCVCKMLEVDETKRMDFIMLKEFVEEKFGSIYDENVFK